MNYKRFPLGALWTNGYLFWDEETNGAFFIDPGGDPNDVLRFLQTHELILKMILLTHGHIDHIAGIHELIPFVGSNIFIDRNDSYMLRRPPSQLQKLLGVKCDAIENFQEIQDGRIINFDEYEIKVIETPGHTEGSVCFLIKDKDNNKILISGDTLFAQSVGRTDLEGGDYMKLNESLLRLGEFPDDLKVLPGHGPETSIGDEKLLNPYWPGR